ncbi:universal stress protein [Streptomyces sp. NPDC006422]|uniref:universal stress protein n=1 Tax=unclassified Streptomyces TaxID=2593676 RepID=UPI0033B64CD2
MASSRAPIMVGIAPGLSHRVAVAWAADEAARRHRPLHLLCARHPTVEHTVREALALVAARHPQLETVVHPPVGSLVTALRHHARTATAVVVGPLGQDASDSTFATASDVLPIVAYANCPVVVVHPPGGSAPRDRLVVGVNVGWDGRRHSTAPLNCAFEAARLRGVALHVLYVWRPPVLGVLDERAAMQDCRMILSQRVTTLRARYPDVEVRQEVRRGCPSRILTQEAADALGLIVGGRGHSDLIDMLSAPVLPAVLRRAPCPVVVVPCPAASHHSLERPRINRVRRRARSAVIPRLRRLLRPIRAHLR